MWSDIVRRIKGTGTGHSVATRLVSLVTALSMAVGPYAQVALACPPGGSSGGPSGSTAGSCGASAGGAPACGKQDQPVCTDIPTQRGESRDPVNFLDGFVAESAVDLRLPGIGLPWAHSRSYNSRWTPADAEKGEAWIQGVRWMSDIHGATIRTEDASHVAVYWGTTNKVVFTKNGANYDAPADYDGTLSYDAGVWTLKGTRSGHTWEFGRFEDYLLPVDTDTVGLITKETDRYGNTITFIWDNWEYGSGRLASVTTSQGWSVQYGYLGTYANGGRIGYILVKHGDQPVMGAVYVYYESNGYSDGWYDLNDLGTDGDLIMVHSLEDVKGFGTSQSNSTKCVLYDTEATYQADELIGCKLVMADGANPGAVRTITDNGATWIRVAPADDQPGAFGQAVPGDTYFVVRGPVRTTQYRYCKSGNERTGQDWGQPHQLKMVLEPATVERIVSEFSLKSAAEILCKSDTADLGAGEVDTVEEFADRIFQHYTTAVTTHGQNVSTPWGDSQNLDSMYANGSATEIDESGSGSGYVRSELIRRGCGGCAASGGMTRTYFYMGLPNTGINEVKQIVVEDTTATETDPDDVKICRRVYGVNKEGVVLREVFIDQPSGSKYWCWSTVVGTNTTGSSKDYNRVIQRRMPSAHTCVDGDNLYKFLDPTDGTNDFDTLEDSQGVIYVYQPDSEGRVEYEGIAKGQDGLAMNGGEYTSVIWLKHTRWGDATENTDDTPKYLPWKVYVYPKAGTAKVPSPDTRACTTYGYTFWNNDPEKIQVETVTYPTVGDSENGPEVGAEVKRRFDEEGRVRWLKDGEGRITYCSYNANTGQQAYVVQDINTDSMPGGVTNPPGDPDEWDPWQGNVPAGFTQSSGLNLETKQSYDDLGQLSKIEDPAGKLTYFAYLGDQTRTYRYWDAGADKPRLPVEVTRTDAGGNVLEQYQVSPTSITFTDPPTGSETFSQGNYVGWTKYQYSERGVLKFVDRYHDAPAEGDGQLSTNYYRTAYRYDQTGRRTHVIEVVSGTDPEATDSTGCVEQVTQTEYDKLGRVKAVYRGVSAQTHAMGADFDDDPTLHKVVENFYDQSAPGEGADDVGDGLVTSTLAYYDAAHIDADHAVKTIYHYNWRGQLRGIEPEATPYTVQDVDHLGRVTAEAQFVNGLTWTTVCSTTDYAATTTGGRRTLAKTSYDQMGRAFRTEVYGVTAETGASVARIVTDNYYDRNSRLVGTTTTAGGGMEYAYDGAGRQTQVRMVKALAATKYSDGAFQYRNPKPADPSGGDDGVVQIVKTTYDNAGNVTDVVTLEANHLTADGSAANDNGLNLTADNGAYDYVQHAAYNWYDDAHRLRTAVAYGTGGAAWSRNVLNKPNEPSYSGGDGIVTKYVYNGGTGRLEEVKVTDPATGNTYIVTKYAYDDLGRTVKVQEAQGADEQRTTLTEYDGLSNVVKLIADLNNDGDGEDANDQVTTYTFADGHDASLVTKIQYPDGDADNDNVRLTYDLDGKVATRSGPKRSGETDTVISFNYDLTLRRLVKQRVTQFGTGIYGGNSEEDAVRAIWYAYDSLGRISTVTSYPSANETTPGTALNEVRFAYNALGMPEKHYQAHSGAVDTDTTLYVMDNYDGDTAGQDPVYTNGMRLKSVRYPSTGGSPAGRLVHYTYGASGGIADKLSRLAAIKDDNNGDPNNTLASYSYNGAGRLAVEDFEGPDVRLDYYGGAAGTYAGFDRYGRIQQQLWRYYGGTPADRDKYAYGYDCLSSRTYRQNALSSGKDWLYGYDKLARLVSSGSGTLNENKNGLTSTAFREQWGLSPVGNWQTYKRDSDGSDPWAFTQAREHNKVNEIDTTDDHSDARGEAITGSGSANWVDPRYDAAGNMSLAPRPGDESTASEALLLVYDPWNRPVKVYRDSDGDGVLDIPGDALVAAYAYDGLNRRVKKVVAGDPDVTYDYYYNTSWQVLEVRKSGNTHPFEQYAWSGRYIDAPVVRWQDADDDGNLADTDETLYYLTDANMNVTCLADTAGSPRERYAYEPYGKVTFYDGTWGSRSSSAYANDILYCGYRFDSETGLYHVRNRYYHPALGIWVSRDPLGQVHRPTPYEYARSGPAGRIDPAGLESMIYSVTLFPESGWIHIVVQTSVLNKDGKDEWSEWREAVSCVRGGLWIIGAIQRWDEKSCSCKAYRQYGSYRFQVVKRTRPYKELSVEMKVRTRGGQDWQRMQQAAGTAAFVWKPAGAVSTAMSFIPTPIVLEGQPTVRELGYSTWIQSWGRWRRSFRLEREEEDQDWSMVTRGKTKAECVGIWLFIPKDPPPKETDWEPFDYSRGVGPGPKPDIP